jgi:hypothetical protein
MTILKNDGAGTEATFLLKGLDFTVTDPIFVVDGTSTVVTDNYIPEDFKPIIAADDLVYDGKWFLSFSAQDKASGIDHYEVCEGELKCTIASSPYLLKNQYLNVPIVVKAVDKSGNVRTVIVPPRHPSVGYDYKQLFAIIGLIIMAAVFFVLYRSLWKKRKK